MLLICSTTCNPLTKSVFLYVIVVILLSIHLVLVLKPAFMRLEGLDAFECRDAVLRVFIAIYSTGNLCSAPLFFRPSTFIAVYSHLEIRGESVGFVVG